jgi:hypothetical protein
MSMKRAVCLLRDSIHYRKDAFCQGLKANGYEILPALAKPGPGDLLVVWNRYAGYHETACAWERAGATVLVAENGYLGKDWRGGDWYSLALGHHAGAGRWHHGGDERWDSWGVELAPWRTGGSETLIFAQRGIGEPGIASPDHWAERMQKRIGGRIRPHPGKDAPAVPLLKDLENVQRVVTWHSAAALHSLIAGVPVWFDFDQWIGATAGQSMRAWGTLGDMRADGARLYMFRRLAWAMWTLDEIREGVAIAIVLSA